ncbi:ABC transporter permease [Methanoregula formicica]|uniref:ABC-type multidrug transport system, permease component n=1 Tax=Methanoregula formicica (strain DSM 22288 / NBRC 105244 / SMSP) TaxID=593750 RepID=L0HB12_METFS|nr:ABC transporter permease [Methanoregula formicica]AGB01942.1 ABC-type multidrug transport system, permease component [Methanoregula formicica SMSP]
MNGTVTYMKRDFVKWGRGKVAVISALIMPAAWLVFVGLALPVKFTGNYLDFIVPGILVMTMLSAGLSGGALLMFDKILGFLNKFLALPTPRSSILVGKILFITGRGLIQATIILAIAFLIGATLMNPVQYCLTYFILFLFGVMISAFATTIALYLEDHDSYSAFNTMISMPLFFTSSALMPYNVMPAWLATIAHLNPLSYAIDAVRDVTAGGFPVIPILILFVLTAILLAACVQVFRRVTI